MEAVAKLNYLRMGPRKVGLVADIVRGVKITEALRILAFSPKKAAKPIEKLLRSAVANANQGEFGLDMEKAKVSKIIVNQAAIMKRFMPRAMGRATEIQKKLSHVFVEVSDGRDLSMLKQEQEKKALEKKSDKKKVTKKVAAKKTTVPAKKTAKKVTKKESKKTN